MYTWILSLNDCNEDGYDNDDDDDEDAGENSMQTLCSQRGLWKSQCLQEPSTMHSLVMVMVMITVQNYDDGDDDSDDEDV